MRSATTDAPSRTEDRHTSSADRAPSAAEVEAPADELDDTEDRRELRRRYDELVSELRVILPGVQILAAFLLTIPFSQRFELVDGRERGLYGTALTASVLAVVALVSPTALHRVGDRRDRAERLRHGVLLTRFGLAALALALVSAVLLVGLVVFNPVVALLLGLAVLLAMAVLWVAVPLWMRWRA